MRAELGYASDRLPSRRPRSVHSRRTSAGSGNLPVAGVHHESGCRSGLRQQDSPAHLGVDLSTEFTGPGERNLLALASSERFASQAANWSDLVRLMVGLAKGDPRGSGVTIDRPHPWIERAIQTFMQGDPKFIGPFMTLWEDTAPLPNRTRHHYIIRWRHGDTRPLRFFGVMNTVDVVEEWTWNDWIPADGDSWNALEEICGGTRRTE